jgi:hypothetical protein
MGNLILKLIGIVLTISLPYVIKIIQNKKDAKRNIGRKELIEILIYAKILKINFYQ